MTTALPRLLNLYPSPKALRRARLMNPASFLALLFTVILTLGSTVALAQATTTQFASGITTPQGGVVLSGLAIKHGHLEQARRGPEICFYLAGVSLRASK